MDSLFFLSGILNNTPCLQTINYLFERSVINPRSFVFSCMTSVSSEGINDLLSPTTYSSDDASGPVNQASPTVTSE
jgi:hypothetical protein